jgi:hypothetical protein
MLNRFQPPFRGYRRLRRHPCEEEHGHAGPLCYPSPEIVGRGALCHWCPVPRLIPALPGTHLPPFGKLLGKRPPSSVVSDGRRERFA